MPWTDNGSGVGGAPWSRLGVPCIVHGETRLSHVRCSDRYEATSTPARDPQGARARALSGLQRRSGNRRHRLLCADARPSSRKFLLCVRACARVYTRVKKKGEARPNKRSFSPSAFQNKTTRAFDGDARRGARTGTAIVPLHEVFKCQPHVGRRREKALTYCEPRPNDRPRYFVLK